MKNAIKRCESGLTLVELLTAVSIIVIMSGSTYAVFNTSIKVYNRTQSKIIQAQRSRFALEQLGTDLSQMQVDTTDELLSIVSQDIPTASGDRDIISFVTLVKPDPDPFSLQLLSSVETITPPLSDVRRVAYYVGPKVPREDILNGNIPPPTTADQQSAQNSNGVTEDLALYRVVSTALNPELVIGSIMDVGTIPTVDENGMPVFGFDVTTLIGGIVNFDLKYTDEESIYESWDQTDAIPISVQILLSVIDEDRQQTSSIATQASTESQFLQGALTESTMVYIPASANANTGE